MRILKNVMKKSIDDYTTVLSKVSFKQIFLFWIGYMFIFGAIYFFLSFSETQGILYKGEMLSHDIDGFITAQYFSFITAASASQGYGDVFPHGTSRFFAVIEAVSGLIIFGVIISKLLSEKQEILLQEVYDLSFEEKINRIRSALYLFRSDVSKLIEKIENNALSQRRISDLWITFTTLENSMHEIIKLIRPQKNHHYVKQVDDLDIELILGSIILSLKKSRDLFTLLEEKNIQWRNDTLAGLLEAVGINITELSNILKKKEPNPKIIDKLGEVMALASEISPKRKMSRTEVLEHAQKSNGISDIMVSAATD